MRPASNSIAFYSFLDGKPTSDQNSNTDLAPAGFTMGYDYCAEHEWGIETLGTALGVESVMTGVLKGAQSTRITNLDKLYVVRGSVPPARKHANQKAGERLETWHPFVALMCNVSSLRRQNMNFPDEGVQEVALNKTQSRAFLENNRLSDLDPKSQFAQWASSWSSSECLFVVTGEALCAKLNHVLAGLHEEQGVGLGLGGDAAGKPFGGAGPCFTRLSQVPQEVLDSMQPPVEAA